MRATKKDFVKMAELCKRFDVSRAFIDELCDILKDANPAFRYDKFKETARYHDKKPV